MARPLVVNPLSHMNGENLESVRSDRRTDGSLQASET